MLNEIREHTGRMDRAKPEILFASLQTLLDSFPDMIFVKDMNFVYVAGTQSFADMMGQPSMDGVLGRGDYELLGEELAVRYRTDDEKLLQGGRDLIDYVEPLTDADGQPRYSSTSKYILTDGAGEPIGLLGISRDITREFKAQQHYRQEIEYLFTLPEDIYTVIYIDVTDWRIIGQRNREDTKEIIPLFGSMDQMIAAARSDVFADTGEANEFYQKFSRELFLNTYAEGKTTLEWDYRFHTRDGEEHWLRDEMRFLIDPKTGHLNVMIIIRDIEEQKRAEQELVEAAASDLMTGLLNRATAQQRIEEFLTGPGANGIHAAFMIDVDDFKTLNDTYGHQEGDEFLIKLAQGVKSCFRETDIVARIGGDEFFVLAKNMPDREAIKARAEQLLSVVREVHSTRTAALTSVSVGVSTYPEDGGTLEELYNKADTALYKAKNQGKDQASFASGEGTIWSTSANAKRYEAYNSQVVEHSNSICYISDMETYDLLHITKAGMDMHGMTRPEEYLGRKCYEVIAGLSEPCPFCPNSKLTEGKEYRWEHYLETVNKWLDRTSSVIQLDGRPRHLEIGRDITARKEELSLLSGKLTMEDVLFRCLHTLTSEKDMDTALNLFLEALGGYYQATRAYIFEQDPQEPILHNTFEWCGSETASFMEDYQGIPIESVKPWYDRFETEGVFAVNSVERELDHESQLYRDLKALNVKSLLVAPLIREGEVVGLLGVNNPRQKEGNLTLLQSVAEFAEAELERRRLISELEHMSYTDTLTGMKNRNQYDKVLKEYEKRTPASLGVVFVDVNGLKAVNDAHGHSYGDHIIKKTGRIIKDHIPGTVFRTGGDEFVALSENIDREDFQRCAMALRHCFERERDCNVSIGCVWREQEENIQSLLLQAGELLAAEKQSYYHSVLQEGRETPHSASFTGEVAKEIREGRFAVYYQPQVDIQSGKIIGAEALVRKRADDGSMIPPNKFIPFYEMEGVVSHVDLFVMREACATMRQWIDLGYDLHLSVNFSRVTLLEPGIVEIISGICREHNVPPSTITIEVTESISKMDHEQLKELIGTINDAGFTISLDDFGSQYSNLAILATMDFDEIKFDKSLVKALEDNPKSRVVMENSVRMCRDLPGTVSLAEGIETKGQLDLLADYQCDYGQGYFFSKPVPPEEFRELLKDTLGE